MAREPVPRARLRGPSSRSNAASVPPRHAAARRACEYDALRRCSSDDGVLEGRCPGRHWGRSPRASASRRASRSCAAAASRSSAAPPLTTRASSGAPRAPRRVPADSRGRGGCPGAARRVADLLGQPVRVDDGTRRHRPVDLLVAPLRGRRVGRLVRRGPVAGAPRPAPPRS